LPKIPCAVEKGADRLNEGGLLELKAIHRDYAKLLEDGVNEDFLSCLSPSQARELLKGILYLRCQNYSIAGE
jgi:hypothetical protein